MKMEFDKAVDLVPSTDEILKTEAEVFDFQNPQFDPIELSHILTQTMIKNHGIGLAAPQIGISLKAFVINANPVLAVFNPKIVDVSEETALLEEGCLSFPDFYVKVKRPATIKVRFAQPNGEIVTRKYGGMTARIFQHEMDHTNGILFFTRASNYHREKAQKEYAKLMKQKRKETV